MSCLSWIFKSKSKDLDLKKGIDESRESLLRLEIMTLELNGKDGLAKSHEKLLEMSFDLHEAIWGKSLDHRFMFMNILCAEKILRTSVENGLALTDEDFKNDALAQVCMESDDLVVEDGKTHRQIEYALYPDGKFLFVDTTKSPWKLDNGDIIGTIGFGKDISEQVPDKVKEKCKNAGWVEIDIDLLYSPDDIEELFESEYL